MICSVGVSLSLKVVPASIWDVPAEEIFLASSREVTEGAMRVREPSSSVSSSDKSDS